MKRKILISFLLFVFSPMAFSSVRTFDRTWLGLFSKKQVAKQFSFWTEGQARMDNDRFVNQQLLLRLGILTPVGERSEWGLLYAHVQTGETKENRPTLQYQFSQKKAGDLTFNWRQRLEYRKLEGLDAESFRTRTFLRFQKGKFLAWEEAFITLTNEDWTGNRIFERNRFFVGLTQEVARTRFEVGYMHQYVPRRNLSTHEHILTLYLFY